MKRLNFYLIGFLSFWLLISCGQSDLPPLPKTPSAASASVPPAEVAAPVLTPVALDEKKMEPPFQYNPEGRRDPFRSIIVLSEKQALAENLPPLQRKEVSELKLIGIVWGGFGYGAVIQTPDGKGYPVRKGTRVGLNNGIISQITNKEVIIKEKFLDIFNETKMRDVVMELHPRKEGLE
jgi:type IV pilus assembly protein PilP